MKINQRVLKSVEVDNPVKGVKMNAPKDLADCARQFYDVDIDIYESAFLIMLNRQNETIAWAKISQGGVAGTVIDVKIVAKHAIDCLASSVVLCHNHPSGNLNPSKQDIQLTKNIKEGLKYLDVELLDHIILTKEGFSSIMELGYI